MLKHKLIISRIAGSDSAVSSPVIIAPARALMVRTLPRSEYLRNVKILKHGMVINLNEFVKHCIFLGYTNTNTVISPGQFARRGGIIDIWVPIEPSPVRLEFYGNEIDTIRYFNPATQRTETGDPDKKNQNLRITPAREFLCTPAENDYLNNSDCTEYLLPLVHQDAESILEYLPEDGFIYLDDPQAISDACFEIEEKAVEIRKESIEAGNLDKDFPFPYISWSEIQDILQLV